MHLYQQALLTYRYDLGLAYTLLVASIETMALNFIQKKDFNDFKYVRNNEGWIKLFNRIDLDELQKNQIKIQLIKNENFLSRRFRKFVKDNLPESFWTSFDSRAWDEFKLIENLKDMSITST